MEALSQERVLRFLFEFNIIFFMLTATTAGEYPVKNKMGVHEYLAFKIPFRFDCFSRDNSSLFILYGLFLNLTYRRRQKSNFFMLFLF